MSSRTRPSGALLSWARKLLTALALLGLAATTACGDDDGAKKPTRVCDASDPILLDRRSIADADRVTRADDGVEPDGRVDWAFRALTSNISFTSLVLLSTDEDGKPTGGQQWDTIVGKATVPASIGAPLSSGASSWVLGVYEDGERLNRDDGSIAALSGCHELTLYAHTTSGTYFRLYAVEPDGKVTMSDVIEVNPDGGAN